MELFTELMWFLLWSVGVNVSLNILGFASFRFPLLGRLDQPLDAGARFLDGKRILGDSTTWGGLAVTLVFGITGTLIASEHSLLLLAALVFFGHALGSFIKRRLGLRRGEFLPFIDHGDYILLAGAVFVVLGEIRPLTLLLSYTVVIAATPFVTGAAHVLGFRRERL